MTTEAINKDVADASINDWLSEKNAENKTRVQELKDILMPALRELGVEKVTLTYSGSGDSGNVEMGSVFIGDSEYAVQYSKEGSTLRHTETDALFAPGVKIKGFETEDKFNHDTKEWEKIKTEKEFSIEELAVDLGYYAVEHEHCGWELNEGSDGSITILPNENKVFIEHTQYVTSSEYHESEL